MRRVGTTDPSLDANLAAAALPFDQAEAEALHHYLATRGFAFSAELALGRELVDAVRKDGAALRGFLSELRTLPPAEQQTLIDSLDAWRVAYSHMPHPSPTSSHDFWNTAYRHPLAAVTRPPLWSVIPKAASLRQESGLSWSSAFEQLRAGDQARIDAIYRPVLRQDIETVLAAGKPLPVEEGAALPSGAAGLPDEAAFRRAEAASDILERNPELRYLDASEKNLVRSLAATYHRTVDAFYQGENALLRTLEFTEAAYPNGVKGTIDRFIQTFRFKRSGSIWWTSSEKGYAQITGKSSRSLARTLYGPDFRRTLFWPTAAGRSDVPELASFRIALNQAASGRESIEVMVKDAQGSWHPFLYERQGNTWLPIRELKLPKQTVALPTRETCLRCHATEAGRLSPRPAFLKTPADFHGVGYTDPALIQKLMAY